MKISRQQLIQEIALRQHIQETLQKMSSGWVSKRKAAILEAKQTEDAFRKVVRELIPKVLFEDMAQTKEDAAISLVRDTLLAVVKIIKSDQGKFKDPEVQDGFIKYCLLALENDFQENHGEEGEEDAPEVVTEQLEDDGDENIDLRIKPTDDPMFIDDKEEEEEEDEEPVDLKQSAEKELFLTLSDGEKVGFRYAKETTWPKVTKQIKRIHKMAIPDPEIAQTYETWLKKNIKLHGENTKEETAFESEAEEQLTI